MCHSDCSNIEESLAVLNARRTKRTAGCFDFNDFNTFEEVSRYTGCDIKTTP